MKARAHRGGLASARRSGQAATINSWGRCTARRRPCSSRRTAAASCAVPNGPTLVRYTTPFAPRSARRMITCRLPSSLGNLPCKARNDDMRLVLGLLRRQLHHVATGRRVAARTNHATAVAFAVRERGSFGSSDSGPPLRGAGGVAARGAGGVVAVARGAGGVVGAATGRPLGSAPSGRMVTVRTRFGSLPGVVAVVAGADGVGATACGSGAGGNAVVPVERARAEPRAARPPCRARAPRPAPPGGTPVARCSRLPWRIAR